MVPAGSALDRAVALHVARCERRRMFVGHFGVALAGSAVLLAWAFWADRGRQALASA